MASASGRAALAATRAALDPARQAWQNDILISAVVEILTRRSPLTEQELVQELGTSWVTAKVPTPALQDAIQAAEVNDLIQRQERAGASTTFEVTPNARREAESDQEWAQLLQTRFEDQVRQRLEGELGLHVAGRPIAGRAPVLAQMLMRAMVEATGDLFRAAKEAGDERSVDDVRVNLRAAVPELRDNIEPVELGEAVANLLLAAADPGDDFATEMLETISTGQLLHGMVCRRDVDDGAFEPVTLIFDTSELLTLVDPDPTVRGIFLEFLSVASDLGATFIIPQGVLAEWKYQWEEADKEIADGAFVHNPATGIGRLAGNPAVAAYLVEQEASPGLKWTDWSRRRRSLDWHFAQASVSYKVSDPPAGMSQSLVSALHAGLRLKDPSGSRPRKTDRLAHTDAISAAWVAHARESSNTYPEGTPNAWFVANDYHTSRLYRAERPGDPYPLAISSRAWLLRYASVCAPSKGAQARLLERLATAAVMNSFVSVVSSFTARDLAEIRELLDEGADEEDVRDAIRTAFWDAPTSGTGDTVADYSRRRARRRDERAQRDVHLAAERERDTIRRYDAERQRADAADDHKAAADSTVERQDRTIKTLKRLIAVVLVDLFLVAAIIAGSILGPFPIRVDLLCAGVIALVCVPLSFRYVTSLDENVWVILTEVGVTAGGIAAPYVADATGVLGE